MNPYLLIKCKAPIVFTTYREPTTSNSMVIDLTKISLSIGKDPIDKRYYLMMSTDNLNEEIDIYSNKDVDKVIEKFDVMLDVINSYITTNKKNVTYIDFTDELAFDLLAKQYQKIKAIKHNI